jgi:hypothetical protein
MEARYEALRRATEEVAAVDAHAHNLVEHGSAFPFLRCFSEAEGDALALAPHSLSFKVKAKAPPPATSHDSPLRHGARFLSPRSCPVQCSCALGALLLLLRALLLLW